MMTKDSNIVLVVDDDPGMLKCVQRLLRGYPLIVQCHGKVFACSRAMATTGVAATR